MRQDGPDRKDTYLFGHPTGARFRSPAEFIPHVYYLASKDVSHQGPVALENMICLCKYCGSSSSRTPGAATRTPTTSRKTASRLTDAERAQRTVNADERMGEQLMPGWMLRKGEIVWVWTGEEELLQDVVGITDSDLWAAAMVLEKPTDIPPFKMNYNPSQGAFHDIEMDNQAPWQDQQTLKKLYTVQICTDDGKPGQIHAGIQQHCIRPWLARPNHIRPSDSDAPEHPSVSVARDIVKTFSFFERIGSVPAPHDLKAKSDDPTPDELATLYKGIFLGAEKIFVGDPIRITSPRSETEDVLVLDNIYISTNGPPSQPGSSMFLFNGSVYFASDNPRPHFRPLTAEQKAQLPVRMRLQDSKTGKIPNWFVRNKPDELGELSIKCILGRWYETEAVGYWMFPDENARLGKADVKKWVKDRADALKCGSINKIQLNNPIDMKKPRPSMTVKQYEASRGQEDRMDIDPTPEKVGGGFKSINPPGSQVKSRMAMAVEEDQEEDEEEEVEDEEVQPGPQLLEKSPTKRYAYRG